MDTAEPWVQVYASRTFPSWLAENNLSIAFTTYQTGKLFFLGRNPTTQLSVFERTFNRCLGLTVQDQSLWVSSLFQIWKLENSLEKGNTYQNCDRLYIPRVGWTTGDVDAHDLAIDGSGRLLFVNTLFSCLATLSERHSFTPVWKPAFISKLAPEDRCHLNGLAMIEGRPRYMTACSSSDLGDGWRDQRQNGGCLIDVERNEIVLRGLSMPHSPRWHQGKLWMLDSGRGQLGYADVEHGRFEPVAFCPGYARGLAFHGDYAIVGLSLPRHDATFSGLALDDELKRRGGEPRCGLVVIDLNTGDTPHWVRIEGMVRELYDVATLPGVVRPGALGFKTDEIQRQLSIDNWAPLAP